MMEQHEKLLKWYPPRRFGGSKFVLSLFFITAFVIFAFVMLERYDKPLTEVTIFSNTTSPNDTDTPRHTRNTSEEHGRGKRVTRSTVSASRSRWRSEYNRYHRATVTIMVNTTSTLMLQPCDFVWCGEHGASVGEREVYVCYIAEVMDLGYYREGGPLCSSWKQAVWYTGNADWGYEVPNDHTNLTNRLSIKKVNYSSTGILLTLTNAQYSDQGYFVVCIMTLGRLPCGSFYLEVISPSTSHTESPHLTQTFESLSNRWGSSEDNDAFSTNAWLGLVKKFTRDVGYNDSCYVCSLFPHSQKQATPVKPHTLNLTEVVCALTALKDVREEGGQFYSAFIQPSPCGGFANRTVRAPNGTIFKTKNGKASDSIGQFHHSLMKY
ncbi:uncharacterized protein LOC120561737 [Perca fluviatilis]|uniref:uncharacterized protein LOC120561737 n=1 Tax=Perca fluviatilis TaxID=8168 RepID=UPI001965ACA1|nr:uncharacterized protein LOC120561737 [Perca fluviatilis]